MTYEVTKGLQTEEIYKSKKSNKVITKLNPSAQFFKDKQQLQQTQNAIEQKKVDETLKGIYRGITYKFFKQKLKKIINKNILINTLDSYDEIILIGSGKGVASIQTIRNIKWKRRSLKFYKKLSYIYNKEISKCLVYK